MTSSLISDRPVREELTAGLSRVDLLPKGTGYFESTAGVRGILNAGMVGYIRAEAGYKPADNISLFVFGEINTGFERIGQPMHLGWMAGVGLRWTF